MNSGAVKRMVGPELSETFCLYAEALDRGFFMAKRPEMNAFCSAGKIESRDTRGTPTKKPLCSQAAQFSLVMSLEPRCEVQSGMHTAPC